MTDRATAGRKWPLLVLDFDGVICDSVEEGWVSSWIAYHRLYRGQTGGGPSEEAPAEFRAMRPFLRSGEDFLMIQELIDRGAMVSSQAEFDTSWQSPGVPSREAFKDMFYRARTALLEKDRQAWLSMNRIYPHVAKALARIPPEAHVYVLSTKKALFVCETLSAHEVRVPAERVLYSGNEPKLRIVGKLLDTLGCDHAIFVEDQVDALLGNDDTRIQCFLASWGYVQEEWLQAPRVTVLNPDGFEALLAAELG